MKFTDSNNNEICKEESPSEEVTDIIERFPDRWATLVSLIVSLIVLITFLFSVMVRYPDVISGYITIKGKNAPVRIVSNCSGRLHLLCNNKTNVSAGDYLGYIENGAKMKDVLILDSLCRIPINGDVIIKFPDSLTIGSLSSLYNDYVLAYARYDQLRNTELYNNMKNALFNQKKLALTTVNELREKEKIQKTLLEHAKHQYQGDSILHASGVISDETFEQQQSSLLASKLSNIEYCLAEIAKHSEVNGIDIELAKINLTVEEELRTAFNSLVATKNILTNELTQWKNRYLLISPLNGTIEYLGFWRENVSVNSGIEIFSVSSKSDEIIGEMYLPAQGAGKVKKGQDLNIKLEDFPYDEFGVISGKVQSISKLTRNIETSEGMGKAYLVEVIFPKGLITNYNFKIHSDYEVVGTADIITRQRRLIERLFDNIKTAIKS